jgi:predicted ATPase/class 3 adenylate cyclase
LELLLNGMPLPRLGRRKGHWLLAALVLRQGCEVERSWLAGLLWPESSEREANASLRVTLSHLRGALGPEADRLRSPTLRTLCLDLAGAEVDVAAFDAAIARGDGTSLQQAVALYRGPLLEGCTEEWAFQERQVREQAYLQALETLAAGALTQGAAGAAAGYLGRATAVDPLRESAQRGRMEALAAGGNYAAALLTYRELRLRLHRDLNAEPDPETQTLFQQLRAEARAKAVRGSGRRGDGAIRPGPSAPAVAQSPPLPVARSLPTGTVTFLLTDIEGSTRHWLDDPGSMRLALVRHDELAAAAIEQHDGLLIKQRGEGDSLFAVFARASDAVAAALEFQRALAREAWPAEIPLQVRVALHTGEAEQREGDYYGLTVNHCARLRAVGHGGQTLLSQTTAALVGDDLPAGASLRELGAHRLKDLQRPEPLFQLVHPELPVAFPPLRSLEAFAHNLPVQLTSFIGRKREIGEVKRLLSPRDEGKGMRDGERTGAAHPSSLIPPPSRLVTLTGAGGCGKTRLALQVAADLVGEYAEGAWLVELEALSDPGLVPQAVASTLGVREEPGRPLAEALTDSLRPRSLLLVLDNCEHLLSACAQLADHLLRRCSHLRILATSREALGLLGEQTYRVPSLSLPSTVESGKWRVESPTERGPANLSALLQSEAVQLFVERALFNQPSFAVTEVNAPAVVQICDRLEGIPLAIELAAARVRALPVEKINDRLDNMFRLLTGGSRTARPRQQTLWALIDWSHSLLGEPERLLLRRLSVFAGGWTLEAAEAVCGGVQVFRCSGLREGPTAGADHLNTRTPEHLNTEDVLDLLTALVQKSLVQYEEREGEARYRLLEPIRQYARERLRESREEEVLRARHRDWFLALAEQAAPQLRGPRQGEWLDHLEREHDNLRLALEYCRAEATGAEPELRLAGALAWFWATRAYLSEGRHRLEGALSRSAGAPSSARMCALLGAGRLAVSAGDYARSAVFLQAGLYLARTIDDPEGIAMALSHLGLLATFSNDSERAEALAKESLVKARGAGDPWLIAYSLHLLGIVARARGDPEGATTLFRDSLDLMRRMRDKWMIALLLLNVGGVAQAQGEYELARSAYQEGLSGSQELKNRRGMAYCLECLAEVAAAQGQPERGARLMGAAEGLIEAIGASWPPSYAAGRERALAAIRAVLGEETAAAALAEGRAMPTKHVLAEALGPNW